RVAVANDIGGGATPLGASYQSDGIRFLRVQNLRPNRFDLSDIVYIDSRSDEQLQRSRLRVNDVVLTITGYPGTAAVVAQRHLPANINQHSVRFRVNEDWNPFYVAAFLNSDWGKAQVERRAAGGTRDALDYPSVMSICVPKVSSSEQDDIG